MYRTKPPTRGPLIGLLALPLALGLVAACAAPSGTTVPAASIRTATAEPSRPSDRTPVLIDTDLGWEDVSAIAYLASRPDVDVRAVTVSGTGEVRCPAGAAVAHRVLAALDLGAVPVACGSSDAGLDGTPIPSAWRDTSDAGHHLDLPPVPAEADDAGTSGSAVELIRTTARAAPGALRVVMLGPATNLADAIAAEPAVASMTHDVTAMGGAITAPGNVRGAGVADQNATAEWNVFADPSAWQAVLSSGIPLTVVPLDATDHVPVTRGLYLALGVNRSTPAARLVFDLLDRNPETFGPGESFWDSLTSMVAFEPSLASFQPVGLHVELAEGSERGRLIVDEHGVTVQAAMAADGTAFRERFISTLNGGAPVLPVGEPAATIQVTFDGRTCGADLPTLALDSAVALTFENGAPYEVGAALVRLADGVTLADIETAIATDPERAERLARPVVATGAQPGSQATETAFLVQPGTYAIACFSYVGDQVQFYPAGSTVVAP